MQKYKKFQEDIVLLSIDKFPLCDITPFDAKACPTIKALELLGKDGVNFILNEVKKLTKYRLKFALEEEGNRFGDGNFCLLHTVEFYYRKYDKIITAEPIFKQGDENFKEYKENQGYYASGESAYPELFDIGNVAISLSEDSGLEENPNIDSKNLNENNKVISFSSYLKNKHNVGDLDIEEILKYLKSNI